MLLTIAYFRRGKKIWCHLKRLEATIFQNMERHPYFGIEFTLGMSLINNLQAISYMYSFLVGSSNDSIPWAPSHSSQPTGERHTIIPLHIIGSIGVGQSERPPSTYMNPVEWGARLVAIKTIFTQVNSLSCTRAWHWCFYYRYYSYGCLLQSNKDYSILQDWCWRKVWYYLSIANWNINFHLQNARHCLVDIGNASAQDMVQIVSQWPNS